MRKIVVTDATFPNLDAERSIAARYGASFIEAHCKSAAEVVEAAADADVLLVQFATVNKAAIDRLAPNAAVVRYGLGLDNIDLKAAHEKGIRVAYVPDYATGEVADHTVTLMLTALRKIVSLDRSVRSGQWDAVGTCHPMSSFAKLTVGFIGFGRIGREVNARLQPFGFSSVVFDPYADADVLKSLNARAVDLDTLFSSADVLTCHAPLTPTTRHIVSEQRLSLMKCTAVIVNTARGALIDTPAMEEALAQSRLGGVALDVFEEEPLPRDSRLRQLPNVILTPHAAWYSAQSAERVQTLAADEVDRHLAGLPPRCPAPML